MNNCWNNLEENKFLENCKPPNVSRDEVEDLNNPEIEFLTKNIQKRYLQAQMFSLENFTKHLKNWLTQPLAENTIEEGLLNSFYEGYSPDLQGWFNIGNSNNVIYHMISVDSEKGICQTPIHGKKAKPNSWVH